VLGQRLKVPPALTRFTKTLDKSTAATLFKLLLKYRPEARKEKKERLLKEAESREAGQKVRTSPRLHLYFMFMLQSRLLSQTWFFRHQDIS